MVKVAVIFIKRLGFRGLEGETAERVLRRLITEGENNAPDFYGIDAENLSKVSDLGKRFTGYDIFVFVYGKALILKEGINALARIALYREELSGVAPVSNQSRVSHQRYWPPYQYHTISAFKWASRAIWAEFKDDVLEVEEIDGSCLAVRGEVLEGLPKDSALTQLPEIITRMGLRFGIARGVYAHCYGDCYESGREDLLAHVPLDSRDVLDIGCANGLFGEMLKKRQRCMVTGIDHNPELVNLAKKRLDTVIEADIEDLVDRGKLGWFDCIVCGDVLEHLNNPWKVVKGLRRHLKKGGVFLASTPNIANWGIIYEMLKGRWNYVPFTILSGTHIRFFTRESLSECLEEAGYIIKEIYFQDMEIPPEGALFIERLKRNLTDIDVEELRASEIVIIAEAG